MTEKYSTLFDFYKGWDVYQDHLVKAITPLSPEQIALRAAPHLRSIGEIAAHIIGTRIWWFHYVMGEDSVDSASLTPMETWGEDGAPVRTAAELASGLEITWHLIQDVLTRRTPADLDQTFQRREHRVSRQWIIWHVIEHDLHHGGELSFTLGMHRLAAP